MNKQSLDPEHYERVKEYATLAVGGGGVSLSLVDVVTYAQAVGVIAGSFIACYQLWKIVKNEFVAWKRRAANDR